MHIHLEYANLYASLRTADEWLVGRPEYIASAHLWRHKWPVTFCLVDGATIYKYIFILFMRSEQNKSPLWIVLCNISSIIYIFWRTLQLPFKPAVITVILLWLPVYWISAWKL